MTDFETNPVGTAARLAAAEAARRGYRERAERAEAERDRLAAIVASLPIIDFPAQTCPACAGEHPGSPCPQEVLPL